MPPLTMNLAELNSRPGRLFFGRLTGALHDAASAFTHGVGLPWPTAGHRELP
jgi:hypothetical protein